MGSRHVSDVYDGGWGIRDSASCGDGGDATGGDINRDYFVRRALADEQRADDCLYERSDDGQRMDRRGRHELGTERLHRDGQDRRDGL